MNRIGKLIKKIILGLFLGLGMVLINSLSHSQMPHKTDR